LTQTSRKALNHAALAPLLAGVAVLGGCASYPRLATPPVQQHASDLIAGDAAATGPSAKTLPSGTNTVVKLPGATPPERKPLPPEATAAEIARLVPDTAIDATLPPQPVPQFINGVFGDILHVPYSLGPNVSSRSEIIAVRSAPRMSQRAFVALVQTTLRDYGLVVSIQNGSVQVDEAGGEPSDASVVLRSRSTADTPDNSRTVTQFVQLYSVEASTMQPLVQDLFPNARGVKITPQPVGNYLVVAGTGRDVSAAVGMITTLDQPRFAGAQVSRIEPTYWRADAFAKALSDALTTEGFLVSNSPSQPRGIMILPLATTNQVLAFAGDSNVMSRIQFWAQQLDSPSSVGEQKSTFVYNVRNTDAASLGALARGQQPQTFTPTPPTGVGVPGTTPLQVTSSQTPQATTTTTPNFGDNDNSNSAGQLPGGGSIVVDTISNRILFTGSATQFAQLRDLLSQLDTPPRQVLIEVTVAEVTLTDSTKLGLEFFFNNSGNQSLSGGTQNGLGIGNRGLNLTYKNANLWGIKNLQAQFNAFASNNNVNILSRPRITAKSGGDAQIQVGTDIPIISSQAAAGGVQGSTGATEILQSVQYRQTGVILKVKPTVYGGNRVDIDISQEVSNQLDATSGEISSPTIQNRSIATSLSLQDGATAVLGGLISSSYSKGNNGIPFLKDIPILGTVFRTDSVSGDRDELVVLVTPHIIHDSEEMSALADSLAGEVNRAYRVGEGWSYTLSPYATGYNLGAGPPAKSTSPNLNAVLSGVRAGRGESSDPSPQPPPPPPAAGTMTIPKPQG
jgi:general secretion pathway protein D